MYTVESHMGSDTGTFDLTYQKFHSFTKRWLKSMISIAKFMFMFIHFFKVGSVVNTN